LPHVPLTPEDESLHQPTLPDESWGETQWFSLDQPGDDLSVTLYPFFRPNLGVAALAVYVWDASGCEPWAVRYGRQFWHLPMPDTDLTVLRLGNLSYECVEPFGRYRVAYADGSRVKLELEFTALGPPHLAHKSVSGGHIDQALRVTGSVQLPEGRVDIDCLGMRDKSWGLRPDTRSDWAAAYTFGNASADEQFLVVTAVEGNTGTSYPDRPAGYLVHEGKKSAIVRATRSVTSRVAGHPVEVRLEAEDELGRRFEAVGRCRNRLAFQALAGTFAWMSMVEWRTADGLSLVGEDQECWSPDRLGPGLLRLNDI
jgi:hypothetical protein